MSLFFSAEERDALNDLRKRCPVAEGMYWALQNRADRRAASAFPGWVCVTTDWWHHAAEFLADTALAHAIKPSPKVAAWLHASTLAVARRPLEDWIGPAFRDHTFNPPRGNLETAHLSFGIALVLDLAPEIFSESERDELKETLKTKALPLCLEWLDRNDHLANWRCVLTAGLTFAALFSGEKELLAGAEKEYNLCLEIFQPDGSHGESLQYGHYAAYTQILTREALLRSGAVPEDRLRMSPISLMPVWQAYSYFYRKPMWDASVRPRCANFNDSAASFRPSADFLLTVASRCKQTNPTEAGLARWLFDTLYTPITEEGPHDLASFGFVNDFGFLALIQFAQAAQSISPEVAKLTLVKQFECGDVFARDSWNSGRTVLAVRGVPEPLCGPGHLHGDLNSFILVHNQERMLVDPGHSCYRNLIHELDKSTQTHNTCTFTTEEGRAIEQKTSLRRRFDKKTGIAGAPVSAGGKRLLLTQLEGITAIGSECSALYGDPISEFSRFWFLCGSRALFVVDRIRATKPVRTSWNWMLNNRDGLLDLKALSDRLVVRRGASGMKLFHLGKNVQRTQYAFVHDYYHPLPGQDGEGKSGSGRLVRWVESQAATERTMIHCICLDHYGTVAGWHFKPEPQWPAVLEGPQRSEIWKLKLDSDSIWIENNLEGTLFEASQSSDKIWQFQRR